jgi:hypothetical protein
MNRTFKILLFGAILEVLLMIVALIFIKDKLLLIFLLGSLSYLIGLTVGIWSDNTKTSKNK